MPNKEYLCCESDAFPIGQAYWNYIITQLYEEKYITGVTLINVVGSVTPLAKIQPAIQITPKGIEYLQEV